MRKSLVLVVIVSSWFLPRIGFGNTGVFLGAGAQVLPIKNNDIQLVRENVAITLRIDEEKGQFGVPFFPRADVEAEFELKNVTNRAVKLQVGFPFFFDPRGFADEKKVLAKLDFRAGDAQSVRVVSLKEGLVEPEFDPNGHFRKVFVWDEEFGPAQTRKLIVRYRLLLSIAGASSTMRGFDASGRIHNELDRKFPAIAFTFSYITRTAYTWKAPLEKATFSLDATEFLRELEKPDLAKRFGEGFAKEISRPVFLTELAPTPAARERNRVTWEFTGKVPEDGLAAAFVILFIPSRLDELPAFLADQTRNLNPEIAADVYPAVLSGYYSRILRKNAAEIELVKSYFEPLKFLQCELLFKEDVEPLTAIFDQLRTSRSGSSPP